MARSLLTRLEAKIAWAGPDDCWVWMASTRDGYGQIRASGTTRTAHLVLYEIAVGKVPEGLELDHLCRNRRCVNWRHLEEVSHQENLARGQLARRKQVSLGDITGLRRHLRVRAEVAGLRRDLAAL